MRNLPVEADAPGLEMQRNERLPAVGAGGMGELWLKSTRAGWRNSMRGVFGRWRGRAGCGLAR